MTEEEKEPYYGRAKEGSDAIRSQPEKSWKEASRIIRNMESNVSVNFGYWKFWKMLSKNACKKIEELIVKILKEFNYFGRDWASMLHIEFKSVTDTKLFEVVSSVLQGELSQICAGIFIADNPLLPSIIRRKTATFDRGKDNCIATEFDSGFIKTPNSIQVPSHFTEAGTVCFSEPQTIQRMLKCFKCLTLTLEYEYPVNEHLAESNSPNLLYHTQNGCDCSNTTSKAMSGVPVFSKLLKTKMLPPQSSNFEVADVSLHDQQSQKARSKVFTKRNKNFLFSKSNQQTLDVDLEPPKDQETAVAEPLTQPRHQGPTSTYVSTSKSLRPRSLLSSCTFILLFSMLIFTMPPAISGFSEIPSSQVVTAGEEAEFRCQYNGASFIVWTVNGSFSYPPGSFTESRQTDDGTVSILTIPALPEYNGTRVECVATVINGTSASVFTSPTALLLVINSTTTTDVINSTTTTDVINSTTTTDGFIISPEDQIVPEDIMSEFKCQHNATQVTWRVNGKLVTSNVTHVFSIVDGLYILNITAKPEFNNSMVECEDLELGQRKTALLLIQGTLELRSDVRIVNHTNGTCTASWGEAASLNITNVQPDVLYEVALYQLASTCGDGYQLINTSTTFETRYTFDQPNFPYELLVTPRNNVEGAKNGSSKSHRVTDYVRFNETTVAIIDMPKGNVHVSVVLYPQPKINELPGITPASCSVSLETFDDEDEKIDEPDCPCYIDNTESKLIIKHQLPSQRLWNYHVYAGNCTYDALSSFEILSTHYVQNITTKSTHPGQIQFCGDFVANSTAKGFLVIANNSNVFHSVVLYREMIERKACLILGGLSSGTYNYSVFTLDENGLPITRSAYVSKQVDVESDNMTEDVILESNENISAETIDNSNCTGVFIRCTIKDDSADSCVAVVYKKVTTSPYGLLNIDVQHLIGSEGVASGCVKNVTFDIQNIFVFSYSNSSGLIGKKAVTLVSSDKTDVSSFPLALVLSIILVTITVISLIVAAVIYYMRSMSRKSTTVVTESGEHSNVYSSTPKVSRTCIQLPESTSPPSPSWINTLDSQTPLISPNYQRIQSDEENYSTDAHIIYTKRPVMYNVFNTQGEYERVYSEIKASECVSSFKPDDLTKVVYSVIKPPMLKEGHYSEIKTPLCVSKDKPDDLTKVVYSDINLKGSNQASTRHSHVPSPPPFTSESVHRALLPVASKWLALGEAFPLSDKRLDDITTAESDEICLKEMVDVYMLRADLDHSWDGLATVLKKIGEDRLADKIRKEHVSPYLVSLPNQPNGVEDNEIKSLPPFRKADLLNEQKPPALPPKPLVPFAQHTKTVIPCEESQHSLVSEKVAHGKVLNKLPTTVPTSKPHDEVVVSCEESQQLSEISSESEVILNEDHCKELNNSHNAQAKEDSGVSEGNSVSNPSDAGIENGESVSINIDNEELSDYHSKNCNKRFSDGEDCESGSANQNDDRGGKEKIHEAVVFEYLGDTKEDYRHLIKLMSQDEKPECDLVQIGSPKPLSTASQEPTDNYMNIIARQLANNANQSQSKPLRKVQTPNSGKELYTLECHQFETPDTEESSDLKIRLRVDKFAKKRGDTKNVNRGSQWRSDV